MGFNIFRGKTNTTIKLLWEILIRALEDAGRRCLGFSSPEHNKPVAFTGPKGYKYKSQGFPSQLFFTND
jgi:hypothetical protein